MPRRLAASDVLALLALAALACGLLWPFVLYGRIPLNADYLLNRFEPWWRDYPHIGLQNPELDDPVFYSYPIRMLSHALLRRGIVPLWNPYIFCGIPLLADTVSLPFDPFGLLTLALPFPVAWGMMILAQLVVVSWSAYALLRYYGCSRLAAFLSGLTLMGCGTFTVWLEYISWVGSFCWAPLCLLCVDKSVRDDRTLPALGAAVLMALSLLGGSIQLWVYLMAMVAFYGLWMTAATWLAQRDGRRALRALGRLALAVCVALLLASAQLLPTLEVAAVTHRSPYRYVGANALRLPELLTYLAPNLYGHPAFHDRFGGALGVPNYLTRHGGYLGVLPLVLALLALSRAWRDARVAAHALVGFGTLAFLVALGLGLELPLVRLLPIFGGLHAKRQVAVYSVCGSVLAGFGLDVLVGATERKARWVARGVGAAALAALLIVLALDGYGRLQARADPESAARLVRHLRVWRSYSPGGVLVLFHGVVSALVALGATWAALRLAPRLGRAPWLGCLLAVAGVDLAYHRVLYNPFSEPGWVYPPMAATRWLRRQAGIFRISGVAPPIGQEHPRLNRWQVVFKGDMLPPDTALPYFLCDARGKSSLYPRRIRRYARRISGNPHILVLVTYDKAGHRHPLFRLLGVRYVLSAEPLDGRRFRLVCDGPVRIYERRRALPRVLVVPRAIEVADDDEAMARLARADHDPFRRVVVARSPQVPAYSALASAAIETYGPNEVRVRITRPGGGVLVLTDTWYPGWRAYVDGERRPVLRANVLMRAVALRPGDQEVAFVYEPEAFRLGLFLSLVGLAIVFAFLGARWAARRTRES